MILTATGLLASGCSRGETEMAAAPVFELHASSGELYTRVLPQIQNIASARTKVIRVDEPKAIVMRFSVGEKADQSLRLVEIRFSESAERTTEVSVVSRRFSFMPGRRARDATDVSLEGRITALIREQAKAGAASDADDPNRSSE